MAQGVTRTKGYARLMLLPVCAGIALGVFSAYADGIFAQYWQVAAPYPVRVAWVLAGVMGNGAGVWAIGALLVGYAAARTTRRSSAALVASVVFLLLAVASYYGTIVSRAHASGCHARTDHDPMASLAVVVGIISGTAGAWLVGGERHVEEVPCVGVVHRLCACRLRDLAARGERRGCSRRVCRRSVPRGRRSCGVGHRSLAVDSRSGRRYRDCVGRRGAAVAGVQIGASGVRAEFFDFDGDATA